VKVCILTEGGKNVGFGHITRCISIYQAFEEIGIRPELIVNGDETISGFAKNRNCRILDWLNDRETLFAVLKNTDIVFVDSYFAGHDLYERISKTAQTAVYFDDDIRINYPRGFVVNGAILAERMPYPKRKGVTYLLGAQYTPLRREFWDVPAKPIRDVVEAAMITFGGSDIYNLTPKVLKLLVDVYPEMVKKVVIGRGFRNTAEIEALKGHNTELIYYPDAAEMKKLMLESDIAISAGGQTLYELARVGVPTIGVCVADNQLRNVREWAEAGFLKYIDWKTHGNLEEELESSLEYLANKRVRIDMSEIGRRIIDGQGCKRIINGIRSDRQVEGAPD
jgi:UDP-2,4-diacetamido-2,4,6-trideoxy-beta-L-altropyranose hydrolase